MNVSIQRSVFIVFQAGLTLGLLGCGNFDSLLSGSSSQREKNANQYDSSVGNAQDNPDEPVSSQPAAYISLELQSGNIAFDLGIIEVRVADEIFYQAARSSLVGIQNQYYAANMLIDSQDAGTSIQMNAWAILSGSEDKSWMQTTCKPQTPGPGGAVPDICELAGPIIDAQVAVAALDKETSVSELLTLLKSFFPNEEFSIVASGDSVLESSGESIQHHNFQLLNTAE